MRSFSDTTLRICHFSNIISSQAGIKMSSEKLRRMLNRSAKRPVNIINATWKNKFRVLPTGIEPITVFVRRSITVDVCSFSSPEAAFRLVSTRPLAEPDFLSMRGVFVSYSHPIRFDGRPVNRALPVLDPPKRGRWGRE